MADQDTTSLLTMLAGSATRHIATSAGVWLAGNGLLAQDEQSHFVSIASGIVLGAAGFGWSWWQKKGHVATAARLERVTSSPSVRRAGLAAAVLIVLAGASPYARAADLPTISPTKAKPLSFLDGYPQRSGFYFGLYTEAGGGSVSGSVPGVNSASLSSTQAGVGGLFGHAWTNASGSAFVAVEAKFGWSNFNGSAPGLSFSGPAVFEQRVMLGTPISNLLAFLPSFGLPSAPPFPTGLAGGVTPTDPIPYLSASVKERDVSLNFGAASNKVWQITPAIGVGTLWHLPNGVVADTYATVELSDRSTCVGGFACGNVGTQYLAGVALKY